MKNRYRNPWHQPHRTDDVGGPEFYENNAPLHAEHRGVQVFKLHDTHFDYVVGGCCITQRAGCKPGMHVGVIDEILDGAKPVDDQVVAHLVSLGFKPVTYEQDIARERSAEKAGA